MHKLVSNTHSSFPSYVKNVASASRNLVPKTENFGGVWEKMIVCRYWGTINLPDKNIYEERKRRVGLFTLA